MEINRNSVENSLAHKYGQMKLDAITSLVDGFENAVYLGTMPDSRERGVVDHYFAYPINYKGQRCYVFCRAMQDANKNRLYVHEVFVEDKIKKGDTLQTAASKPHGGIALYRDILANVLEAHNRHTTDKQSVETAEASQDAQQGDTDTSSRINAPTLSTGKGSEKAADMQAVGDDGSAYSRIAKNQEGKPLWTQSDAETVWDGLVEMIGDEEGARIFAEIRRKEAVQGVKAARSIKLPVIDDIEKFSAANKVKKQAIEKAEAVVAHWERVLGIKEVREAEAKAEQERQEEEAKREQQEEAERLAQKEEAEKAERASLKKIHKELAEAYDDVKEYPEAVTRLKQLEPEDMYEAASIVLSSYKLLWTPKRQFKGQRAKYPGVKEETGFGEHERKKLFGMFASRENGGRTLEELAEDPMAEVCQSNGIPYDNQEARSVLIEVVRTSSSPSDIRYYIERRRAEQAREIMQHEIDQERYYEELDFYQHHGFEKWEYDTYEEVRNEQARKALENFDEQEYYGNIADEMAERQRKEEQLKEKEHGEEGDIETESERGDGADIEAESGREESSDAAGGEVLPGSGSVSARGAGEGTGEPGSSAGVGDKGGKPDGDSPAGGEAEGGRIADNPREGVRFRFARDREDFDAMRERAIEEKGLVMPGLSEKEFEVVEVPRHPFKGSGEEARKAAQEWAKENLVGSHKLIDSEEKEIEYSISNEAIDKFTHSETTKKSENLGIHIAVLMKLPEVIGRSIEAEVHPDYLKDENNERTINSPIGKDKIIHRFYGAVEIDGKIYRVKTTIKEIRGDKNSNKAHTYEVTEIKVLDNNISSTVEPKGRSNLGTTKVDKKFGTRKILGKELLRGVKKSYVNVNLLDASAEGSPVSDKTEERTSESKEEAKAEGEPIVEGRKADIPEDPAAEERKTRAEQQQSAGDSPSEQTPNIDERGGQPQPIERYDHQGNPIDETGKLIIEEIAGMDELTEEDFMEPNRTVRLPALPENVNKAIGAAGRRVIIKKNIFEKNLNHHGEFTAAKSREILNRALYNPNLIGNNKPLQRPDYRVAIQTGEKECSCSA